MDSYMRCTIKSFKHDGRLHRMWMDNLLVPESRLVPEHAEASIIVLINEHTPIQEASGKVWTSRVPAVSFFMPGLWFNVVALLEEPGIRYYCNVASPPYLHKDVLTYIDYDLDVIKLADGSVFEVDRDEYEQHKITYRYSRLVTRKVEDGLRMLRDRIACAGAPFNDTIVYAYYNAWKQQHNESNEV
ncbi:DUF402 domain-containing protein [Paenibacillus daejeonensis]|uniref:DUF402 domain-containing protein n=1 Tax=Paenibacillus daejeonensis TaxID=135193 RepID=UPI000380F56C|nr:DUF402 domain-containing protein [Paenibacillus daejeonensis]